MSLRWLHVKKSVEAQYFNSGVTPSAFFICSLSVVDGGLPMAVIDASVPVLRPSPSSAIRL